MLIELGDKRNALAISLLYGKQTNSYLWYGHRARLLINNNNKNNNDDNNNNTNDNNHNKHRHTHNTNNVNNNNKARPSRPPAIHGKFQWVVLKL